MSNFTDRLFDRDCDFAADRMLGTGELAPMFSIHFKQAGQPALAIVPADFADPPTKDRTVMMVKLLGVAVDAFAISLMTEAWVATVSDKTDEAIARLAPSERMDRREVVMVMMSQRGGKPRAMIREILRSDDGSVSLGAVEPDHDGLQGRMSNLLLPDRPTAEQRANARAMLAVSGIHLESSEITQ